MRSSKVRLCKLYRFCSQNAETQEARYAAKTYMKANGDMDKSR